jgi:hypothetical protein
MIDRDNAEGTDVRAVCVSILPEDVDLRFGTARSPGPC